jgi:hypothetical protein
MKGILKKGRFDASKITEDHIYRLQRDNEISLNLPVRPFSNISELKMIYECNGMRQLEFINYMRKLYGMTLWKEIPEGEIYDDVMAKRMQDDRDAEGIPNRNNDKKRTQSGRDPEPTSNANKKKRDDRKEKKNVETE